MSRVGRKEIQLPDKVTVKTQGNEILVKGPLGELTSPLFDSIGLEVNGNIAKFTRSNEEQNVVALHGLARALLNNCVKGVSVGWEKNLEINGVGYRALKKGNNLVLNLGFSHEVVYEPPKGIKIEVADLLKIKILGIDKELVGQVAAEIRSKKPPEPYKGKGIKYSDEFIKRKAGKTGKK